MTDQLLSDVKVLDLTHYIAGPYCTKLLADYGADLIKIERPGKGDPARQIGPFLGDDPHPEKSALFLHLNTNKRSLTLNLKSRRGVMIFKELAHQVDIVVENFRPGVMDDFGLSYEELEKINPTLVMTSISNFGQTGPYRDFPASEIVLYGMGGSMLSSGLPDREPVKLARNVGQYQTGVMAAVATMTAFYGANYRGIGQHIDMAIFETQSGSIDRRQTALVNYAYTGYTSSRERTRLGGYPQGIYPCKDGYVSIAGGAQFWPRIVKMLDMPELLTDPRFSTLDDLFDPDRKQEFEEKIFLPWLKERTKAEILEKAQSVRVLSGAINTSKDLLENPHFRFREYFVEVDHPVTGKINYPGAPFKSSEAPWSVRRPAPLLGQHNREILCEQLGYSHQDLVKLREAGVI